MPTFTSTVVDIEVAHPEGAFVAILEDGTAQSWGYNYCTSLDNSFYEAMTTFDRGYRFAMGVSEDGSIDYRGCNYCNSEATPGNDFVDVWVDYWDQRFAGAIRQDGSIVMWGCEDDGSHNIPPPLSLGHSKWSKRMPDTTSRSPSAMMGD